MGLTVLMGPRYEPAPLLHTWYTPKFLRGAAEFQPTTSSHWKKKNFQHVFGTVAIPFFSERAHTRLAGWCTHCCTDMTEAVSNYRISRHDAIVHEDKPCLGLLEPKNRDARLGQRWQPRNVVVSPETWVPWRGAPTAWWNKMKMPFCAR